jgi:hypothetical protein
MGTRNEVNPYRCEVQGWHIRAFLLSSFIIRFRGQHGFLPISTMMLVWINQLPVTWMWPWNWNMVT